MGGFDDHVATTGDWMPPTPSPRSFFSMLGDHISSRSITETPGENKGGVLFPWREEPIMSGKKDEKDGEGIGGAGDQLNAFSEQKTSSRGGLVERMAARASFKAPRLNTVSIRPADLSINTDAPSPYLTISPGLSPTTLLDSPVFLSNSQVQPSPTTGKYQFGQGADKSNYFFDDISTSSFAFQPVAESCPSPFFGASKITPTIPQQSFSSIEVSVQPGLSRESQRAESATVQSQNRAPHHVEADFSRPSGEKDGLGNTIMAEPRTADTVGVSADYSPSPDVQQQDEEADQRGGGDTVVGAPSEDGYNWRKYGQKQVKGSEYPRSYYKCTHTNCPVKKKVERSHEGHITEIIYTGAHNHPKPLPSRRSATGSTNPLADFGADGDSLWTTMQKGAADWMHDNLEVTSSAAVDAEFCNGSNSLQGQRGTHFESGDTVDASSTFSNEEDEDDQRTQGTVSLGYDGEEDESDSKRRKIEEYATEMSGGSRATREPRVVVQTNSEVDILDDGYRWRKYGQKVVKGNPNPRSYYKCTNAGCTVRKHVERASHDLKSVITTYEGKHNHDVPAARNGNSGNPSNGPAQAGVSAVAATHLHRPETSQVHNSLPRYDRPPSIYSFGLPGRHQMGPPHGFTFGMNQPGLANMTMLPMHPYFGQPRPGNEMGFMLPKGGPKVEPLLEPPPLNLPNGSSVYNQLYG